MAIKARFNQGRWIADCPHCNGAELAMPGEAFICGNPVCPDLTFSYSVKFPKFKAQIEEILRQRPIANMNWEPGEALKGLRAENKLHGIKEPA